MTEEPEEGYSSESDRAYHLKQRRIKKAQERRSEAKQFEPRPYSRKQEDFARRFNRGISIRGGDI